MLRLLCFCPPNKSSSKEIRADCLTPLEYSLFSSSRRRVRYVYLTYDKYNYSNIATNYVPTTACTATRK